MSVSESIEHKGIIDSINGNKISVSFIALSGCASCHAKGYCSTSEMKEKSVEVYDFSNLYKVGDEVTVVLKQSLGLKAVWLGYILPFILVITALIILSQITNSEAISGLGAIAILIPYYLILFLFKNRLKKTFSFFIKK
ncbi:MAG: SoxR reducing system RseC family protein [Bacteroidales bacterium]